MLGQIPELKRRRGAEKLALARLGAVALTTPTKCKNIASIVHPSVQRGKALENAQRYLTGGFGSLIGFELKGGRAAGERFINALKLFYHVANIGDARSLAIHPASTTHSQLGAEEQLAAGVSQGYVRLSIGLEHIDDIVADLEQALVAAG